IRSALIATGVLIAGVLAANVSVRAAPATTAGAAGTGGASAANGGAPAGEPEATGGKGGPRPLLGVTPRPGPSPELPKPPKDPGERLNWLRARLDELFSVPALAKAKVGAIAIDAESGRTLYARADKTPLNAASNVKIV